MAEFNHPESGPVVSRSRQVNGRTVVISLAGLLVLLGILVTPRLLRVGSLYWAKRKAVASFVNLTPRERDDLNLTPVLIELPKIDPDSNPVEQYEVGEYVFQVLRPVQRVSTERPDHLRLMYPRFSVAFLNPFPTKAFDEAARLLHFAGMFDMQSSVSHTRLDDLDGLPDLPSVSQFLQRLALKESVGAQREEFRDDVRCGFISVSSDSDSKVTSGSVEFVKYQIGCGVLFQDIQGMTISDVHLFLAALRVKPKGSGAGEATTMSGG